MGMKPPPEKDKAGRRSKRFENEPTTPDKASPGSKEEKLNSFSKELARLQFFGAGPKMAGLPSEKSLKEKTRGMKLNFDYDPVRLGDHELHPCGVFLIMVIPGSHPINKILAWNLTLRYS